VCDQEDDRLRLEFAALLAMALLVLWQTAGFVWRALAGWF
jgi:hypothetical protein